MSQINLNSKTLNNLEFMEDISPETAASYSGGRVETLTDVVLRSNEGELTYRFRSNIAVEDLRDFGFNNATDFITVNNNKTWRFYEGVNFTGDYIDVGGDTALNPGDFGREITSFKSID